MGKKKKQTDATAAHSDFGHEIWGLIFLATGVLTLISLISHFVNRDANILGHFFGTSLSRGLIYLFGPIPAFFFPLSISYIGWLRLRGDLLRFRTFFYWIIFTLQICLLLAIHYLPEMASSGKSFNAPDNLTGVTIVRVIFYPLFGMYRFGPYFLGALALIITLLSCFRIPPQRIIGFLGSGLSWLWEWFKQYCERVQKSMEESRQRRELEAQAAAERRAQKQAEKRAKAVEKKEREKQKKEIVKEPAKKDSETEKEKKAPEYKENEPKKEEIVAAVESAEPSLKDINDVEEQARLQLERELAAFRAKKNEPLKIMSIETEEVDSIDEDTVPDQNMVPPGLRIGAIEAPVDTENEDNEDNEEIAELGLESGNGNSKLLKSCKPYVIPDSTVLPDPPPLSSMVDKEAIERNSATLEKTLMNFGVEGKVVFVSPGPVVTRYEIELAPGIKVSRVVSLHDDISMAVGGQRIRIEAPIPGKSAVGIELPNSERVIVHFKTILQSEAFKKSKAKLPVIIGTNISGAPYVTDITKMPHVLIAGQTGSGKSVCINSIICSLLMTKNPEELRLIMIDPKKVELAFYEGIPHLMSPVVTESKEAVKALQWGVREMERRYRMLAKVGARNIDSFNSRLASGKIGEILSEEDNKPLPFIVIIVDELADLMMTASKDVEVLIQRIAQLARAVGIHLIVATQRPSVDIITGPIKANLTSRIAFRTIQSTDSRTILGHVGAEKLLGMGDMLFLRNGAPEIERFHGAFISEEDVEKIVAEIRKQEVEVDKIESFHDEIEDSGSDEGAFDNGERDELFEEAARTIVSIGQGSTSLLQRRMKIGYARAGRLMDELERAGFVGPSDGSKAREVKVKPDELEEILARLH
jgi:DNA segregation ATPase FtsK/SpoIIIE-like protein